MKPVYLDYNATTPIDPEVLEAMAPYLQEHFGNPSSSHMYGEMAKRAVEEARSHVAVMLNCEAGEIVFTSGGTESNNHAINGAIAEKRGKGNRIITSIVEHPAIIEVCRDLETRGNKITYLDVDETGLVDPTQLQSKITPDTVILSVMHANNEVGTIEPIAECARIAHKYEILVHSDCAQSVGKIPVRVDELDVDLLSIAGHKLYAPKGIGALFIKTGVKITKFMHGADHELNRRAGTENVSSIVGLGKACEMVHQNLAEYQSHLKVMRDRLEQILFEKIPDVRLNGHRQKRLPNTLSIGIMGVKANEILAEMQTIAASAGAACHSEGVRISSVLSAMNVPREYALGTLRLSVGRKTTVEEIDQAAEVIVKTVQEFRSNTS